MAQKLFIVDLDLNGNIVKNLVIERLSEAPTNPLPGRYFLDAVNNVVKYWNGKEWKVSGTTVIPSNINKDADNIFSVLDGYSINADNGEETIRFRSLAAGNNIKLTKDNGGFIRISVEGLTANDISGLSNELDKKFDSDNIDKDAKLDANSDNRIPSQKAVKSYINTKKDDAIKSSNDYTDKIAESNLGKSKTYAESLIKALTVLDTEKDDQFITSVSQTEGRISVTRKKISAKSISTDPTKTGLNSTNVEQSISELNNKIDLGGVGSKVKLIDETPTAGDYSKVFNLYQGYKSDADKGTLVGTINLPKELIVKSGSIVVGNWTGNTFTENQKGIGKALKLVIENQTQPIYINVADLVDVYQVEQNAVEVQLSLSDKNVIGATIVSVDGSKLNNDSVTLAKLAKSIRNSLVLADTSVQSINGITDRNVILDSNRITIGLYSDSDKSTETDLDPKSTDSISTALGKLNKSIKQNKNKAEADNISLGKNINSVSDRVTELEKDKGTRVNYVEKVEEGKIVVISAEKHKCGLNPTVQVYYANELVEANVVIDVNGNAIVTWNINPTKDKPITVKITA